MTHAAPIARLAFAYAAGLAAGLAGAPIWIAPLLAVVGSAAPVSTSKRPGTRALVWVLAIGWATPGAGSTGVCGDRAREGEPASVPGRFLASPRAGSGPFEREDGCGPVTAVVGDSLVDLVSAGRPLVLDGRWRVGALRPWLQVTGVRPADEAGGTLGSVRWSLVRWRDGLVGRLERLYGARGPLVAALVFARREGLDRDVRESFTVTGIAHLLAISGFHVGVVAGLTLALLRASGFSRRRSALGSAALAWAYVGFIGFPDAACRAALIFGLVALSRVRGRPPTRWGALAAAALALLLVDPGKLASAGFQLSFAGAAGLVAWARPLERAIARAGRGRIPRSLASACAAGVAATLATLPIVAWHFERVSAIGIPMTLVASPLVSLALPGALVSIALDLVSPGLASFLAGGVDLLLALLVASTTLAAGWPGVSVWTARATIVAGMVGVVVASWVARRPRIGGAARRRLVVAYVAVGILGWPVAVGLEGRGTLELFVIDVGQGDAIGVRTPRGRWILVDAGPPSEVAAAGHPVVRALRARGVRRLEAMVLTHPDADHFGGAAAVLEALPVGRVVDPLVPAPKRTYAELLEAARARRVRWEAARAGQRWELDGVVVRVLHPPAPSPSGGDGTRGGSVSRSPPLEANEASVVLAVSWRGFEALLTGDAYVEVERAVMDRVGDIDVLKVGHHGSDTSTDGDFVRTVRPELALISVGRGNRYGHPSPRVVERLSAAGARVLRTDLAGSIRVVVRRGGEVRVVTER